MTVESFDGPVTKRELDSFKTGMQVLKPSTSSANEWAQGKSGENTKALGMMYEISNDVAILNKMITFCDTVLSIRNDMGKGCKIWTGRVDPVWVNCNSKTDGKVGTGGEQGDPVGHLGYCARLILNTKSILNSQVPDKDPHNYGKTYLDRAKTYVKQADKAVDDHILKSLLDVSRNKRQYFSKASVYKSGGTVPWNQQMMFNYGFMNLAIAHELLGDNPGKVKLYDSLVKASVDWFFTTIKAKKDKKGNPAYDWGYAPDKLSGEDNNHGSLDTAGFSRLYASDRYAITKAQMEPFANTVVDVMTLGKNKFSGRVNGSTASGHASSTNYMRSGYLLMAEFRPEAKKEMFGADLQVGKATGSTDQFSRCMWVKHRLSK
ncbi:hypothetical protein EC988_000315 [Linderina pennispora]|nr:hypothetical protein EC988_000315 [Linderina pennispora]